MHLFEPTARPRRSSRSVPISPGMIIAAWLALVMFALVPINEASAHATGETYVFLHPADNEFVGEFVGRFEIAVGDLQKYLGIDVPIRPSSEEIKRQAPRVIPYLKEHFQIYAGAERVALDFDSVDVLAVPQGSYAQFGFRFDAGEQRKLTIDYGLFFAANARHRGLLLWHGDAAEDTLLEENAALIFGPGSRRQTLDLDNIASLPRVRSFVGQGVWHIWIGLDHVLFIIVLILPAVMRRDLSGSSATWRPVDEFATALWNLLKVVTVFTVAHSITLALAGLDFVSLPSRWVETLIAASIIVMAIFNIRPRINHYSLWLVFVFGLVHGLGFASVMGDLAFRTAVTSHLLAVVLAFNIGVELGQVAIVLAVFPVLYWLRRWSAYPTAILAFGSALCAAIALPWLIERSLDVNLGWSFL